MSGRQDFPTLPIQPKTGSVEDSRLRRWRRALRWYQRRGPRGPASTPASEVDVIAVLGELPPQLKLSQQLGRPAAPRSFRRPAELCGWLARARPQSLAVVSTRERLGFMAVKQIQETCEGLSLPVGFLTARDIEGLSFLLAKQAMARRGLPLLPYAVGDAHSGEHTKVTPAGLARLGFEDLTGRDWGFLGLLAHGEGAHLKLGGAVLCGLVGDDERWQGVTAEGGCSHSDCKRARHYPLPSVRVSELRCAATAYLSCNSFSVAGEMYPSDVSLMLAAADGFPAVAIGYLEGASLSAQMLPLLSALMQGVTFGEAVLSINSHFRGRAGEAGFTLLGDPTLRPCYSEIVGETFSRELPDSSGNEPGRRGGKIWRPPQTAPTRPARLAAAPADLCESTLAPAACSVARISRYETELLIDARDGDDKLLSLVATLRGHRQRIEQITALAWRQVEVQSGLSLPPETNRAVISALHDAILEWDDCFARIVHDILLEAPSGGEALLPLLRRQHRRVSVEGGDSCLRCGVAMRRERFLSAESGASRQGEECPLCGPTTDHLVGGYVIELGLPRRPARGRSAPVEMKFHRPGELRAQPGRLVIDVRDKTRPGSTYRALLALAHLEEKKILQVPIAPDASWDQHAVRAVWVCNLQVSYARRLFVVHPDGGVARVDIEAGGDV